MKPPDEHPGRGGTIRRPRAAVPRGRTVGAVRPGPRHFNARHRCPAAVLLLGFAVAAALSGNRAVAAPSDPAVDEAALSVLIGRMTLEEKVRMCFGGETFGKAMMPGVARLGIPDLKLSGGPRAAAHGGRPSTVFPAGLGLAAAWNPALVEAVGAVIGNECNAKGIDVVFGPAMNIVRDPLGGRFFEYFTEDPELNGQTAAAFVRGVQQEGVAACIKHFAANGRELNRNRYMSNIGERALREIYLRGFEIAVKEGHPWTAMTAANGLNGELCSDNRWLLTDVLKNGWGFDGFVLTDFCHSRSTVKAALAGLDVDMPWSPFETAKFGKPLMEAVEQGRVPVAVLDDKVRRILRAMSRIGRLDPVASRRPGALNTPEHQAVARRAAEESLVLLKNTGNLLPLDAGQIKHLVVLGPNADRRMCLDGLGGSSSAQPAFEITPLAGLRQRLAGKTKVDYVSLGGDFRLIDRQFWKPGPAGNSGIHARYANGASPIPVLDRAEEAVDFHWPAGSPDPAVLKPGTVKLSIDGTVIAPATGYFTLRLHSDSPAILRWQDRGAPTIMNTEAGTPQDNTALVYLQQGQEYALTIVYQQSPAALKNSTEMNFWSRDNPQLRLEWAPPSDRSAVARALAPFAPRIKAADAVVFVGGLDHNLDCEGRDRVSMDYPPGQQEQIRQIEALNPKTVVVLIHGSPVRVDGWLDAVPAVLDAFYPGMEGGTAIAGTLFGDLCPAGKLTFSWPKKLADSPAYALGTQDHDNVNCTEGIFVGYRYFDTRNIAPQFPFGFGLSYTTFRYSGLRIEKRPNGAVVRLTVQNTGKVAGAEVVQIYVGRPNSAVERPLRELKGFAKVPLNPGERRRVEIALDQRAFACWDVASHDWKVEPGNFVIEAGSSSRDIRLKGAITP